MAAASEPSAAASATAGASAALTSVAAGAPPPSRLDLMQAAIWLTRRRETSSITPRPKLATRPATVKSVSSLTVEPAPSASTDMVAVALAEPGPVVSRPLASSLAMRAASSFSMILAVPL